MSTIRILLTCLIVVGALGHLTLGQDLSPRAASPDEPRISADAELSSGLGGQMRNVYGQKLSGHRMMHFGKRPLVLEAPVLYPPAGRVYDLYAPMQRQQRADPMFYSAAGGGVPVANMMQDDSTSKAALRKQHLMEIVAHLLEISRRKDCEERERQIKQLKAARAGKQQQQAAASYKLMRLVQEGDDAGNESQSAAAAAAAMASELAKLHSSGDKRAKNAALALDDVIDLDKYLAYSSMSDKLKGSQNLLEAKSSSDEQLGAADEQQQQQPQQQQQQQTGRNDASISLSSRSVPSHFGAGDMPSLTRAQVSSILYGRQASGQRSNPIVGMGSFMKKVEPQKMTFMHFG